MALNIAENQRVRIWEVEDRDTYAIVKMGTSRKDKRDDSYKNSNWGFVRFVGKAYEKILDVEEKQQVWLKGATISLEPYEKDGETLYPKNPQIVVFNFVVDDPNEDEEEEPAPKKKATAASKGKTTSKTNTATASKNNAKKKFDQPPVVEDEDESDDLPF